ncbi:hypothetical protein SGRIM128S_07487 [Streptomyces griseomycini]
MHVHGGGASRQLPEHRHRAGHQPRHVGVPHPVELPLPDPHGRLHDGEPDQSAARSTPATVPRPTTPTRSASARAPTASSSDSAAPCASVGQQCAASPTSTTRPRCHALDQHPVEPGVVDLAGSMMCSVISGQAPPYAEASRRISSRVRSADWPARSPVPLHHVRVQGGLAGGAVAGDVSRAAVSEIGTLDAGRARGGRTPDGHAGRFRLGRDADRGARARAQAVGGDHQVVAVLAAVAQAHGDAVGVLALDARRWYPDGRSRRLHARPR